MIEPIGVTLSNKPLFVEEYYHGKVSTPESSYAFWIVRIKETDEPDSIIDLRWLCKKVPKDVKAMEDSIIVNFKNRV